MDAYTYRVIIEPDGDGYHGYVPVVPGVHTCGRTIDETKVNLREALVACLETLIAHGEPIPEDDSLEYIQSISALELQVQPTKQEIRPYI
ncbi:type II toxin-antitoxin system HicB family antitoxin [Patescibacteria group bacterium]|nr:type II toxin-antitoxin system HicB family antitoxin [Patescibacteria group bacterium]